ncbi:MAG TPA: Ig domain-containing protein [Verrucomicrobiae bacterium]
MLRTIKHFWWVAALILCAPSAWGFALLGPLANGGDSWQTTTIGYGLVYTEVGTGFSPLGGADELGDIGGPKNLSEGYRRNTPTIFYAYDANFLDYFGSNGVVACDSAANLMNFSMTNNSLENLDGYSTALSEFPPESLHLNYEALSLSLTDLKSVTLHLLLEQMGLAEPERFTWTLAERVLPPGGKCPLNEEYLVIQRNYADSPTGLDQLQYSSYVNDTLYTYEIEEFCTGSPLAVTVPFSVDPNADEFTAVAANNADGLGIGGYYTSLTRDDVGGLRYLYTSNNIVRETPAFAGTTAGGGTEPANLEITNVGSFTTITTSNLSTLLLFAQTNPPALVQSTFGVTVIASNLIPDVIVTNWTFTATVSSPLGAQYGTQIATVTSNAVLSFVTEFVDVFGNVITNGNLNSTPGIIQICSNTIALNYSPVTTAYLANSSVTTSSGQNGGGFGDGGTLTTNTTLTPFTLNVPSGEYITLPNIPNGCGWVVQCRSIANVVATTNLIVSGTNSSGFVATESIVTFFTNHTYQVQPIICTPTPFATSLYEGIQKVQFVRADFDSLVGQFFQPVTNNYTMVTITNSQASVVSFQRVVVQPDILISAEDEIAANTFDGTATRNITFDQDNIGAGLAGPGTINPVTTIEFNKVGDAFENSEDFTPFGTNAFTSELYQIPVVQWASFDASTNLPVLYPNGTSILNLQNQILVQVSPAPPALANGTHGVPYGPITFSATGGAFNYSSVSWQVVSGLGNLPSGLTLSSSGVLSGTTTQTGTFDFTVQMTDSLGRTVSWFYTLIIN